MSSPPSLPQEASSRTSQPAKAATTLLQRRATRTSLTEWARFCGFEPAAHQRLLIEKLEAVSRGEIDRLLVCMPAPRSRLTQAYSSQDIFSLTIRARASSRPRTLPSYRNGGAVASET